MKNHAIGADTKYQMRADDMITTRQQHEIMADFLGFAAQELGISSYPRFTLVDKPIRNKESNSFAAYSPTDKRIMLYVKHRHIMDILRSLCHELVHYRQDLAGELTSTSGKTGSEHENEANSVAGQIMRKYGKLHPELFV